MQINKIQKLHRDAMSLAEKAAVEQTHGKTEHARQLFEAAYEKERYAAELLETNFDFEPTRSILYRSAASLALDCSDKNGAEKLIEKGLMGNPPLEIVTELRDLLKRVYPLRDRNKYKEVIVPSKKHVKSVSKLRMRRKDTAHIPKHTKKDDYITGTPTTTTIDSESTARLASREKDSTSKSTYTCFLSLPFKFQDLRNRIIQTIESLGEFQIACRYVTRSTGTQLRQEVMDELTQCDFIIADVSSVSEGYKGPRPNIMWELGYAWHMGLSRIIMVRRNQTQSNVASLIIDQHYIPYNQDSTEDLLRELRGAVIAVCNKAELARTKQRSEGRYSANVYIDRVEANLQGCIRDTHKNIRILETNLENIVHEYGVHLVKALKDTTRPDLTVQICTLNPHSPFARARALQLAQLEQDYEKGLMLSLREMYNLLCKCDHKRWEIRVYDTFPTQLTFTFDDRVFSSVMSLGKRSREMLHFEVSTFNRNAGDTFRAHFNQIWGLSDTYEDWLKKETSQGYPHKQVKPNPDLQPTGTRA